MTHAARPRHHRSPGIYLSGAKDGLKGSERALQPIVEVDTAKVCITCKGNDERSVKALQFSADELAKQRFDEGKMTGLAKGVKKGDTLSEATKAKMTAAKRTEKTNYWVCPNCDFTTSKPRAVLRTHFHNEPPKSRNSAKYSKECKAWLCEKADDTAYLKKVFGEKYRKYL